MGTLTRQRGHCRCTTGWRSSQFARYLRKYWRGTWGRGKPAVLELARTYPGSTAVIDDLAGRRCAEALGLPLRGIVGLVLAAKQAGRLTAARQVLERLRDSGMYLSDAVLQRALRRVGE